MNENCQSCGMPLAEGFRHEKAGDYCRYCADPAGSLYPYEQVRSGVASWLESFSPEKEGVDFTARADLYMRSMPAWADRA